MYAPTAAAASSPGSSPSMAGVAGGGVSFVSPLALDFAVT